MNRKYLIIVGGPTAVGKTKVSIELARYYNVPIINADSRQVYRELNIGVAKPNLGELNAVKHFLIGTKSIHDHYDAGVYEQEASDLITMVFKEHDYAILSGGSGLYIRAITHGLDKFPEVPEVVKVQLSNDFNTHGIEFLQNELQTKDPTYFAQVDRNNPRRLLRALEVIRTSGLPFSDFLQSSAGNDNFGIIPVFLNLPREELYLKIEKRVDGMMEAGLLAEAEELFVYRHLKSLQTVGYQEMFAYLSGDLNLQEAIELLKRNSRRYAKRQITWFKKYLSGQEWSPYQFELIINHIQKKIENGR